jgi:hypothetical protein
MSGIKNFIARATGIGYAHLPPLESEPERKRMAEATTRLVQASRNLEAIVSDKSLEDSVRNLERDLRSRGRVPWSRGTRSI